MQNISIKDIVNSIIPISRFNKGEANKIFDEVAYTGYKIVMKNNTPTCILLSPERYTEMMEAMEDMALCAQTEERLKNPVNKKLFSESEIMAEFNITSEELTATPEVEIEL